MLTLSIQIFVWTWLIAMSLGAFVLMILAALLGVVFVRELQALRRMSEQARSPWAHIADPWNGFTMKHLPGQPLLPASSSPRSPGMRNCDLFRGRARSNHGKAGGGINIEMNLPDPPSS